MLPVFLSVMACFGWGVADFIGGLKSRTLPTLSILMISTVSGTVLLALILAAIKAPLPHDDTTLFWAIPAGPVGVLAMYLLYRSLSLGTMSILAPISATGVILPVIWGLLWNGDSLSGLNLLGICAALAGSALAVMEKGNEGTPSRCTRGVGLAIGSAVFVGSYFILMDTACTHHPVWASMIMRLSTLFALLPLLYRTRTAVKAGGKHLPWIVFMGCMDTLAAFCFALATSRGMLSEVAVISSLYPAVTVVLSTIIAGERIQRRQSSGVVLAIAGVVLISAF